MELKLGTRACAALFPVMLGLSSQTLADSKTPAETVETIYIGGALGKTIIKACIGDQLYLITRQSNGPSGITPSLHEGKPERCQVKAAEPVPKSR
jgi:hypothetical protein